MYHPETMHLLVKDHQERLRREASDDRLVREATSVARQEPRERFRVRDLRWVLFRPAGA
jgi:hypothetical protein